jgi:hypothetical protein
MSGVDLRVCVGLVVRTHEKPTGTTAQIRVLNDSYVGQPTMPSLSGIYSRDNR